MGSHQVEFAGRIEIPAGGDSSARAMKHDVHIVEVGRKGFAKRPQDVAEGSAYCARPAAGSGHRPSLGDKPGNERAADRARCTGHDSMFIQDIHLEDIGGGIQRFRGGYNKALPFLRNVQS